MDVFDIIDEQDELAAHKYEFALWPRMWREYNGPDNLDWKIHKLSDQDRQHIPNEAGVYTLLVQPGVANHPLCSFVMYVGEAVSLRRRFGNYLTGERRASGRPKVFRVLNKYSDYVWFCFATTPANSRKKLQDQLIVAYHKPPCNDQVPASIRKVTGAF